MICTADGSRRSRTCSRLGSLGGVMTQPALRAEIVIAAAGVRTSTQRLLTPVSVFPTRSMIQRARTVLPDIVLVSRDIWHGVCRF
jgi:hypothetical protein